MNDDIPRAQPCHGFVTIAMVRQKILEMDKKEEERKKSEETK